MQGLYVLAFMPLEVSYLQYCTIPLPMEGRGIYLICGKKMMKGEVTTQTTESEGEKKGEKVAMKGKAKDRSLLMWSCFGSGKRPNFIVQVLFTQI